MKRFLLACIVLLSLSVSAQNYLPSYKYSIVLSNTGAALSNYKLLVNFAGSSYIALGKLQSNFNDIRFSEQATCPTTFMTHYIENVTAGTGKVWVNIPSFPVGTKTIYMYFGDATAASTSNFSGVFPSAYISGAVTTTMSGVQNYDWFEVSSGATINVAQSQALTINASNIVVKGVINGAGKGFTIGALSSNGSGPGAGTFSTNATAGAGGGSYGGVGGTAGYDVGDLPGSGGPAYGTAAGNDVNFGSAGGSSSNTLGGNGGGQIILNAKVKASVTGTINVNGANATIPGISFGGGGGAGGCVFISADYVEISGAVSAAGGNGSTGNSAANDSGGGGGGGRIKLQYGLSVSTTGSSISVAGGVGGPNGFAAPGQPGGAGTLNTLNIGPKSNVTYSAAIAPIVCFPLPVNFVSFDVAKNNQTAVLDWVTNNETNSASFDIERSIDAVNFKSIGNVPSKNLTIENAYTYTDMYPVAGVNYYRLKQIDLNGEYRYTEVKSLLFNDGTDIKVFPNPTQHEVSVYIENFKKPITAKLLNQVGQVVKELQLKQQSSTISMDELPKGIYFLIIQGQVTKVVKE
jgi:hypothetical protein